MSLEQTSHSVLLPRGPRRLTWRQAADHIANIASCALVDATHPWAPRWPTSVQAAAALGCTPNLYTKACQHLAEQGIMVKKRMPRHTAGYSTIWVPVGWNERRYAVLWMPINSQIIDTDPPSQDRITAEILRRGQSGEWKVLPATIKLGQYFHVDHEVVRRAIRKLQDRRLVMKLLINGHPRWCVIPPSLHGNVDRRFTVPIREIILTDMVADIEAGRFRYRMPDGIVHEQPFPTVSSIARRYDTPYRNAAAVRDELVQRGLLVPGAHRNAAYVLADHIPAVDRTEHPVREKRRTTGDRAREIADDVAIRITSGELTGVLSMTQVQLRYKVGCPTGSMVSDLLHEYGLIQYRRRRDGSRISLVLSKRSAMPSTAGPLP